MVKMNFLYYITSSFGSQLYKNELKKHKLFNGFYVNEEDYIIIINMKIMFLVLCSRFEKITLKMTVSFIKMTCKRGG